jgi:lipopolysaccharide cholinephosphotransferase
MQFDMYNTEGSSLRNVQLQMLEMIKVIDGICQENGIEYFLNGGSALCAARHKGFIPWDDDMDIALLEHDYKKLIKILKHYNSNKYVLQMQSTDFNYINEVPKFRMREGEFLGSFPLRGRLYKWKGPGIDIFCFQRNSYLAARISAGIHSRLLHWTYRIRSNGFRCCITKMMYVLWLIIKPLCKVFNILRKPDELHNALGMGYAHFYICESHLKPLIRLPFEDTELPVPAQYDKFLTSLFGDWRTPPSKEEILRHGTHSKELINLK